MIAWWHPDIGITVITAPHLVHCEEALLSNSSDSSRKSGPLPLQRRDRALLCAVSLLELICIVVLRSQSSRWPYL